MKKDYAVEVEFIGGWKPVSYHSSERAAKTEIRKCLKRHDFFGTPVESYRVGLRRTRVKLA